MLTTTNVGNATQGQRVQENQVLHNTDVQHTQTLYLLRRERRPRHCKPSPQKKAGGGIAGAQCGFTRGHRAHPRDSRLSRSILFSNQKFSNQKFFFQSKIFPNQKFLIGKDPSALSGGLRALRAGGGGGVKAGP